MIFTFACHGMWGASQFVARVFNPCLFGAIKPRVKNPWYKSAVAPSGRIRVIVVGLSLMICCATRASLIDSLKQAQWRVNDVSTDGHVGLTLQSDPPKRDPVWTSTCTVIDTTGNDRAVTLSLCIPLDATNGQWCDDPQTSRLIQGDKPFANLSDKCGGVNDSSSLYPLCVITHGDEAICLAVPITPARLVRFVYDPNKKELRAEFDFGLSKLSPAFPSRADATVIAYPVPAKFAFRQALAKYHALYSNAFERTTKSAGIWLPFNDMQSIDHPEDFGFGFHEYGGDPSSDLAAATKTIAADHAVGCRSYIYVEPPTYWQKYNGAGHGDYEQRLAQLKEEAAHGVKMAQATLASSVIHADGKRDLYLTPVAYTVQAPWGNDADPHLPDDAINHWQTIAHYKFDSLETALGWHDGSHGQPTVGLDGVYIDSMEGWGELLDYNNDHWKASVHPLTFDDKTHRVALLNFWGTYEFIKEMHDRLHAHGNVLMGNDAYFRRWCLAPWVDVPGREYTWIENGKFAPVPDERYLFFRSMSYRRPYLMLMNNQFTDASVIEPYMQRSVFYAVYPGFFSDQSYIGEPAYFDKPEWYNRDRPLFKKYVPMVKKLDEAGWQPLPFTEASSDAIRVERYGEWSKGDLAFTIHNNSAKPIAASLQLYRHDLGIDGPIAANEWIANTVVGVTDSADDLSLHFDLPADAYRVIQVRHPDIHGE